MHNFEKKNVPDATSKVHAASFGTRERKIIHQDLRELLWRKHLIYI